MCGFSFVYKLIAGVSRGHINCLVLRKLVSIIPYLLETRKWKRHLWATRESLVNI